MFLNIKQALVLSLILFTLAAPVNADPQVRIMRTPDKGIQPQVKVDAQGGVHLIYYKGKAKAGDIFYVKSADGGKTFSKAIRVNSLPGTAVAVGTIRGAQMTIGRDGRVHVAWNGSQESIPVDKRKEHGHTPMLYTRLNDKRTAFEPQRNLMTRTHVLDGGGSVAADLNGNVYVAWHGLAKGKARREEDRAVWVTRSSDDGKTFSAERRANTKATGACGCCGMKAEVDQNGSLFLLYRTAKQFINRDMRLLVSTDKGTSFQAIEIDQWRTGKCPMSAAFITPTQNKLLLAWESKDHVFFQPVDLKKMTTVKSKTPATSKRNAKHPVLLTNKKGNSLLVWTEGTGWKRGGEVAWQVFDEQNRPEAGLGGRAKGVPVWSFASGFQDGDNGWVVVY